MFSDSFTNFSVLSEEPNSLCKRLSSILCERDVFPLLIKPRSVSPSFPDRTQIGLGLDLVGLENLTRGASPKTVERIFRLAVFEL